MSHNDPPDSAVIIAFDAFRNQSERRLNFGSGGGTFGGGMEARVAALEEGQKRIEAKLDGLVAAVSDMRLQMTEKFSASEAKVSSLDTKIISIDAKIGIIDAKIGSMPSGIAFGEMKGRVDSLPTTAKVALVIAIVGGIVGLLLKAPELWALIHKTP